MRIFGYRTRVGSLSIGGVALAGVLAVFIACGSDKGVQASEGTSTAVRELTWDYPNTPMGPSQVVVTVPKEASASRKMPVLIALHGQGESRKPPALGARGWVDDYQMLRAFSRIRKSPLTQDDFGGMVTPERLAKINRSLAKRPYRGVITVSPYLPDRFRKKHLMNDAAAYGEFLINTVLPRVYRETPAIGTPSATGIDGVSLGGRASVTVGLTHPTHFGAVGGTQAAFREDQAETVAAWVKRARGAQPELQFRLLSSEKDRFKVVTEKISAALKRLGESHQMAIVSGNHSYEFNRGPGVYEMLIYYDRVLRGEPSW